MLNERNLLAVGINDSTTPTTGSVNDLMGPTRAASLDQYYQSALAQRAGYVEGGVLMAVFRCWLPLAVVLCVMGPAEGAQPTSRRSPSIRPRSCRPRRRQARRAPWPSFPN